MNIFSPKSDIGAKGIFQNEKVRRYFISNVLQIPVEEIRSVKLLNTFLHRWRYQKQGILDILIELNNSTKINIEIQVRASKHWDKRQIFYLAKSYTDDLGIGEDYSRLRRCVSISILDFNLTDRPQYHTVYRLRDREGHDFTDILEVHIIELRKELRGDTPINEWIQFFNSESQEDLDMLRTNNPGILEAIREIKTMSLSRRLRLEYESYLKAKRDEKAMREYDRDEARAEGLAEGLAEGRAEGLAEGRAEGIRAFISICRELNLSPEDTLQKAADKFQLTPEEVRHYMDSVS